MKLLDMLAKLGILRYGKKAAVYRSGSERPVEFLMDDVFDAKRDLTTREDLRDIVDTIRGKDTPSPAERPATCPACGADLPPAARYCPRCGKRS
ncbi:zinc ribbon domain-containing protein [Blastochloris sulfoviridis]|uniref:Zinc ribbon domain-containing protein n=1 Tax=Blastochloris sulfoviridis TaxID=50712 RepID=A0A5M6HJQ5_9HYPH|nr:zinc ribbon domain-containing protein [Blastochloris sulfoviridis]KAA5595975.1 zinc ribbon domain-containing protein [Blastochloris sulfoviridis]